MFKYSKYYSGKIPKFIEGDIFRIIVPLNDSYSYDSNTCRPIIRASICTGEQVAGFKDKNTGNFTEIMLIKNPKDLDKFLKMYDIPISDISKEY